MSQASDASEAQLRRLIEAAPDGIVVSRQGRVLFANPAAVKLLGYDAASELVGQSMALFLDATEMAVMRERVLATATAGRPLEPREYVARRRDGTTVTAEIASLSLEWDGEPAVIAHVRDVTERARMRAQLARADRLAALGTLAAGVAHEVNNPLATMSLALETLDELVGGAMPVPERETALAAVAEIRDGAARVSAIIRDLRAFALEEVGGEEPGAATDVAELATRVARLVAYDVRHRAELRIEVGALPRVAGSMHRLEQVLLNLVLNAAQAFDDTQALPQIVVRGRVQGERTVVIEVRDNGPGIPEDIVSRIFDPFFTTKPVNVGTGLGLAISHRIVTQLGGALSVASELHRGTTFRISLPFAPGEVAGASVSAPAAVARKPAPTDHWRVLVIDDEPAIGRLIRTLMPHHEIQTVTSGEAALELLLHGAGADFDVIVCDLMMPVVNGMDLYLRLAEERPGTERHFVFITGGAFTERATAFLAGIENVQLDKPFTIAGLEKAMAETIQRREGEKRQ